MKVINRSNSIVCYHLPELNIRREFQINEHKDVEEAELEALFQSVGGDTIVKNNLLVEDRAWVKAHWDAPIEYFWDFDDIKNCVLNDSVELFEETLEYAPDGVIEVIKEFAWKLPLKDLNKVEVLQQKTGFNCLKAAEIMKPLDGDTHTQAPAKKERLRREEL